MHQRGGTEQGPPRSDGAVPLHRRMRGGRREASQGVYSNEAWATACSQRAISSWARAWGSVGMKRRSATHSSVSSSVLW